MYQAKKIIDAHQHYWQISREDYGWLTPELRLLYRDYMPDMLEPHLSENGVVGTIAVQAAATVAETEFLLELSESNNTMLGVVGWIDLDSEDASDTYFRLRSSTRLVGFRPTLYNLKENNLALQPRVVRNLQMLAAEGMPLDLVLPSEQLSYVVPLHRQVPDLRVVLDHLGSPDVKNPEAFNDWAECISAIALHPEAMCKISGMITLSGGYDPELLKPYVAHVVDAFGMNRVMFGSDWPVALLAGGYDEVIRLFFNSLPQGLCPEDIDRIAWRNALDFYRIQENLASRDLGEA
ncbi:amidohydrolase [Paenibacillus baekrokdamisoli]|uniref:Amidohydrolase n=1 Tax=Paenibacillus baekrokdamisoli TaxID=1712516 RepID=A0A3G9ITX6_9BACL|nr:amidohydrolase family protein [Paenibacillus baekrokdamisoli]MBB3067317.1 L-fuconolactonase [Paenibacillus baekrokdamisoli]BBH19495.1 amidohydrolase [Paenibacillus baekrokdamisoli]